MCLDGVSVRIGIRTAVHPPLEPTDDELGSNGEELLLGEAAGFFVVDAILPRHELAKDCVVTSFGVRHDDDNVVKRDFLIL